MALAVTASQLCYFLFIYLGFCVSSLPLHLCSVSLLFSPLSYCVLGFLLPSFKESWILSLKKIELFLPFDFCLPKVGLVVCVSFIWVRFVLSFYLFVFPLMGKPGWGGTPVCWWLGLYFCFVCCLDDVSCTRSYWCLGDARSYIQVASFVWYFTIWHSLGLVYGLGVSVPTPKTQGLISD